MPYVEADGVRLWYDVRGEGFPVLFIHGGFAGPGSRLQPRPYEWLGVFAPYYQAVVYHRRGCGWSSLPTDGWSLASQVSDALAVMDALGLEQAHVIGSSAGGPIALLLALDHPRRVRALALANTAAFLFRPEASADIIGLVRQELDTLRREGALALLRRRPLEARISLAALWERPAAEAAGRLEEWQEGRRQLAQQASASLSEAEWAQLCAAEVENMAAYLEVDLRPRLGGVQAPVLVVHGDADRVVPLEWGLELARMLPAAELAVVPGAPHGILGESAEARRRVLEFFLKVDGRLT